MPENVTLIYDVNNTLNYITTYAFKRFNSGRIDHSTYGVILQGIVGVYQVFSAMIITLLKKEER